MENEVKENSSAQQIHFTSDMHIGHKNIITYSQRPFKDVQEMNEALIENWNAKVQTKDIVWNLGDFSFQPYKEFKQTLRRLNGEINLVLGNHDKMIIENREELLKEGLLNSIQDYKELKYQGERMVLFHFSCRVWNGSHKGNIHLYGHSHGSLPPHGRSVDIGVDCKEITSEYRPISFKEVLKYMEKKEIAVLDHHGRK